MSEAAKIVTHRRLAYGHPAEDFARTAQLWSALLGCPIHARQVALCMIALKLSRECHQHRQDNLVDVMGYALALEALEESPSRI